MNEKINKQRRFMMTGAFALAGLSTLELAFGPTARAAMTLTATRMPTLPVYPPKCRLLL